MDVNEKAIETLRAQMHRYQGERSTAEREIDRANQVVRPRGSQHHGAPRRVFGAGDQAVTRRTCIHGYDGDRACGDHPTTPAIVDETAEIMTEAFAIHQLVSTSVAGLDPPAVVADGLAAPPRWIASPAEFERGAETARAALDALPITPSPLAAAVARAEAAEALLREFAEMEPVALDMMDLCASCRFGSTATMPNQHSPACAWLRARKLLGLDAAVPT